jgi:hypothetical protein
MSELRFLTRLAVSSAGVGDRTITDRILARAECAAGSAVDRHAYLSVLIQHTPKSEEAYVESLCRELIALSPLAKKWFRAAWRRRPLPGHVGYQQLAIMKEKQKDYRAAIDLCQRALSEGWSGDWEKRIARCERRRANLASRRDLAPRSALVEIAPAYPLAVPTPPIEIDRLLSLVPERASSASTRPEPPLLIDLSLNDRGLGSLS